MATAVKKTAPKKAAPKKAAAKSPVAKKPALKKPAAKKAYRPRRAGGRLTGTPVKHTCGHTQRHALGRIKWTKEREATRLAGTPCTACWSEGVAEHTEGFCGVSEMPELEGTPRQISWARTIRAEVVARVMTECNVLERQRKDRGLESVEEKILGTVLTPALKKVSAKWWIETGRTIEDPFVTFPKKKDREVLAAIREESTRELVSCPF